MRALILVGLTVASMACTIPNPAFDLASTTGLTASSMNSGAAEPTGASATGTSTLDPTVPTSGGGTEGMTGMTGPFFDVAHPTVVNGGKELIFVTKDNVYSATAIEGQSGKFGVPVPLSPPGTAAQEIRTTTTADSTTLVVARRNGPDIPPFLTMGSDRFFQYQRVSAEPGAGYPGPNKDVSPKVGPLNLTMCPTLAPDGLHLFFASTEAAAIDGQSPGDAVGIYYSSRMDTSSAFVTAQPLAIEHSGPEVPCPSSVTADGCQLVFHRFTVTVPPTYSMHLAVRAP